MPNTRSMTRHHAAHSDDPENDIDAKIDPQLLQQGEAETIRKVLLAVQRHEEERLHQGFNEVNFAAGVLNSMLVAYVFGNFPEHFWLLWALEAVALIPRKIYEDWHALPLRQILYYVDYCWVMNFLIIFALYYMSVNWYSPGILFDLPYEWRKNMYFAVLGVASGPLLGATAAMPFVAVVFHDHKMMTSLFIHLTPPMLVYTFQWHADEILEAWPSFFALDQVDKVVFFPEQGPFFWPGQGLGTVAGNAVFLYFCWFIPYVTWMLTMGLDLTRTHRHSLDQHGNPLPTSKYDTAFHCVVREGMCEQLGVLLGRSREESRRQQREGDYETRDFIILMTLHAIGVWLATMILAQFSLRDKHVHAALLWLILIVSVYRGAQTYVYWVTSMSSKALQEEFAEILKDVKEEIKKDQ